MRVASVDIGTNAVLLLIVDVDGQAIRCRHDVATITRLGQGVDATGRLADEAVGRTLSCLEAYAQRIEAEAVDRVVAVATSVMRDARHGAHLLDRAEALLGVRPAVIAGLEEARLTFEGALSGLDVPTGRWAICDVGGGSTEMIVVDLDPHAEPQLRTAVSLDMGCVRLTERTVDTDPPTPAELDSVRHAVREALGQAPNIQGSALLGTGGTITTLAALAHQVAPYAPEQVHGSTLTQHTLRETLAALCRLPLEQRRRFRGLDPARADVIVAGAVMLDEICSWAQARSWWVSDRGLRWGLALRVARRPARNSPRRHRQ